MPQGPDDENENTAPLPPDGWQQPPQGPPPGPPQGWQPPPPGWQPPPGPYGYGYPPNPAAPYGIHPITGVPYSDKSKVVAGVLQLVVPLGIGRFYMGDTNIGIAQLLVTLVTCGVGAIWPFID